ncbi:MAG: response regulator [Planctomycetota bacterium]|nr:MAG: response regulator [Planctomycetota bacterium]
MAGRNEHQRLLLYCQDGLPPEQVLSVAGRRSGLTPAESLQTCLELIERGEFAGILFGASQARGRNAVLDPPGILQQLPIGVAIVEGETKTIVWCNEALASIVAGEPTRPGTADEQPDAHQTETPRSTASGGRIAAQSPAATEDAEATTDQAEVPGAASGNRPSASLLWGRPFFDVFPDCQLVGTDYSPFGTALGSMQPAETRLVFGDRSYADIVVARLRIPGICGYWFLVLVRDVTEEVRENQKLTAVFQAGLQLSDLDDEMIREMGSQERIELLRQRVVEHSRNVLHYESFEIRLIDPKTKELRPLLAMGMADDARSRKLYARATGNGVSGFVAATGKSCLVQDTREDPLYLPGAPGARSALTVPIVLHDQVLGTFNVESTKPRAFTAADLRFLELFARELAVALNTLKLLDIEKRLAQTESSLEILKEIADPVDEVLNEATALLEEYIGYGEDIAGRIQKILHGVRSVRSAIQKVGLAADREDLVPEPSVDLRGVRVLVVDRDRSVRRSAHELLSRYHCTVESARTGAEGLRMARLADYDVIIAEVDLGDICGFDFFKAVREIKHDQAVILMTGFGYDPSHSMVKAKPLGLAGQLYKPFRREKLLEQLQNALKSRPRQTVRPDEA